MYESQKRAAKKWATKNRDRKNYLIKRTVAKTFILKKATSEDLEKIVGYIDQRKKLLQGKD